MKNKKYLWIAPIVLVVIILAMIPGLKKQAIIDTSVSAIKTQCNNVNVPANAVIYQCTNNLYGTVHTFDCIDTIQQTCVSTYGANACVSVDSCSAAVPATCNSDSDCPSSTPACLISQHRCMTLCNMLMAGGVYSNCQQMNTGDCSDSQTTIYCTFVQGAQSQFLKVQQNGQNYYYCYLNGGLSPVQTMVCPAGESCSQGHCVQQTICTPNQQICQNNKVVACSSTGASSSILRTCTTDTPCVEYSATYADCRSPITYYCLSNGLDCNTWSGSGTPPANCYANLSACQASKQCMCLSADKKNCTLRHGNCLSGELYSCGADLTSITASCEAGLVNSCTQDSDCKISDDCTIGTCNKGVVGSLFTGSGTCAYTTKPNCDQIRECNSQTFLGIHTSQWVDATTTEGGVTCQFLHLFCRQVNTSYCGISQDVWIVLIVVIAASIIIYLLVKQRKRK